MFKAISTVDIVAMSSVIVRRNLTWWQMLELRAFRNQMMFMGLGWNLRQSRIRGWALVLGWRVWLTPIGYRIAKRRAGVHLRAWPL